ncbi:Rha family transcriptional regulator [Laribacter hongkongensis]|uniref:Rha family transcriptional regulator n=1 Tax=Laribacter hongkongensis TaxID=168471 RepID=UPI001EFD8D0E|nr:Rha family transcriptional regulator [Laribacter hongkongensis]MCG8991801.1 Rha family transcriptional regulator [Laribacter hongkongensis]MCG8998726.1 Rha family transcriptional regulator [Laribacter hongkongensis]MCG9000200.1 Rha family transcriptional regulator [Laribacter hongkongensis]MCG9004443.1 Rha family transcriptional regulator [Laribacter hongkongensis]MCG9006590.1 Rha family transcriptional regulator [Laribacter hongkongensis]
MSQVHAQGASAPAVIPQVSVVDGRVTTTSLQVAEFFGKRHCDVLRAIDSLVADLREMGQSDHVRNFACMIAKVEIGKGATREDRAFRLTRDGFVLLAMRFTGQKALRFQTAYIDAFNAMEARLVAPSPAPKSISAELKARFELSRKRFIAQYDMNGMLSLKEIPEGWELIDMAEARRIRDAAQAVCDGMLGMKRVMSAGKAGA